MVGSSTGLHPLHNTLLSPNLWDAPSVVHPPAPPDDDGSGKVPPKPPSGLRRSPAVTIKRCQSARKSEGRRTWHGSGPPGASHALTSIRIPASCHRLRVCARSSCGGPPDRCTTIARRIPLLSRRLPDGKSVGRLTDRLS